MFILASAAEEGASRIIGWLRERYGVPIAFVPFQFYADDHGLLLETERIPTEPIVAERGWSGDWFFNTNESHGVGAYRQMFAKSVIALYGYEGSKGAAKLQRPSEEDRVFAYVNGRGIVAVGVFPDEKVYPAKGVFHKGAAREFHRRVEWQRVVQVEQGIKNSTISGWGYNLPVRETICKIYDANVGDRIERELESVASRAKEQTSARRQ